MTPENPVTWWAEPGPEVCEFCRQTFHIEVGYHCTDCDRPICPVCVVIVVPTRTLICPECVKEGQI